MSKKKKWLMIVENLFIVLVSTIIFLSIVGYTKEVNNELVAEEMVNTLESEIN